ncbi:protein disulfide isomerase [Histomonas meleagridis]|uniref:protein disulfide isomerase n=1 Tax=Histomonas meleagridis TaxID=135588 RepID=UPI003559DDC2|nr:protein disulfide isomerase [Histomonas meleagridis]KAH0796829.1 protein disulfide isomerase [Histomonas meleagridis]
MFAHFKDLLHGKANLIGLNSEDTETLRSELNLTIPSILLYDNGSFVTSFNSRSFEQTIINFINSLGDDGQNPISTSAQLFSMLGQSLHSLIATPTTIKEAKELQILVGKSYGLLELFVVTPEVISSLGLDPNKLVLYRQQDMSIVNINSTEEDFNKNMKPSFSTYNADYLSQITDNVVLLTDPDLSFESGDFLIEVSQNHTDNFVFALGDRTTEEVIQFIIGEKPKKYPFLMVYNLQNRCYYKFDEDKRKNPQYISTFLSLIEQGSVSPTYLSQPIPKKQSKKYIEQIVGLNYQSYVSDESKAAVVLYYSAINTNHKVYFDYFDKVANMISEFKLPIKFGYIDITSNASPMKFPLFIDVPHVHYFPSVNKSDDREVYGLPTPENIVLMLNMSSNVEIPLERPRADKSEIIDLYQRISQMEQELGSEKYRKAMEYLKKVGEIENIEFGEPIQEIVKEKNIEPTEETKAE